jgi:hypothetical protein
MRRWSWRSPLEADHPQLFAVGEGREAVTLAIGAANREELIA